MTLSFPKPLLPLLFLGLAVRPGRLGSKEKTGPRHRCCAQMWSSASAALLAQMTLEEKVGQLNQYSGREVTGPASDRKNTLLTSIRARAGGLDAQREGRGRHPRHPGRSAEVAPENPAAVQPRCHSRLPDHLSDSAGRGGVLGPGRPSGESAHVAAREAAASGIHWTFAPDGGRGPRPALGPRDGRRRRGHLPRLADRQRPACWVSRAKSWAAPTP